jgi:carboxyl-terminal processing protease
MKSHFIRRALLFFISFWFWLPMLIAQEALSETEKLAATGKIWGFLKYYHPVLAKGKQDWDKELFRILPVAKSARTKEELSQIFVDWIEELGKVKICKKCDQNTDSEYFDKNFNLDWIENHPAITHDLTERLRYIEQNRHQGKKYYATSEKRTSQVKIRNEKEYTEYDWEDENLRLLSLFRYWNIVEYFFPYKYQTDTDWGEVLTQMIPKFLNASSELELSLAMVELAVNVDDSHAALYTDKARDFFGRYWFPAMFRLFDEKAVITGFYNDSIARVNDLQIGDWIKKVNGQEVETIYKEHEKYISGSNISKKKHIAQYMIFNDTTDSAIIEITRNHQGYTKTIQLYPSEELSSKRRGPENHKILEGNIGYINMGVLEIKDVPDVFEALKNTKALILDIRNYPRGTLFSIANFISSKKNDFYKVIYPDLKYPGKFIWRNGRQSGKEGDLWYKGQVILLVDERTQSQAEFTAMCLQTGDNVTTIGSQTSGADGTSAE